MQRTVVTKEIRGTVYTITEMPARVMLPLVQKMAENSADPAHQIEMMSACITVDGQPVDAGEIGTSVYMQLMNAVMEVNGLETGDDDEKKH